MFASPVKGYASHGESWSVALALRLASAELLRSESPAGDPVLILDDVFAELDADRRQRLAALTAGYEQVVVTAAVEEDIPEVLHAHVVCASAPERSATNGRRRMTDAASTPAAEVPETIGTYLRLRGLQPSSKSWKRKRRIANDDDNAPFTPGRDPGALGAVLDKLSRDSGWQITLAREDLVRQWADLAGADTAKHSEPVSLERGLLTVKCDSTAWAKNLQFMRATILTEIGRRYPDAGVENLRFIGPDVPSWKWGSQSRSRTGPARYLRVGHHARGVETLTGPHTAVEGHFSTKLR